MTLLGGAAIPLRGLGVVLGHAFALAVHGAEVVLGVSMTLLGGHPVPLHRLGVVPRHALPLDVHVAETIPGIGIALLRGFMYHNGYGVPRNYVQANFWFSLSVAQGHEGGRSNREIIARKMTPAQIAEAQNLAREWKPKKE